MDKPKINTHLRLFDLVRFMRAELHQADLITDEEYAWLCMEAPMNQGAGSPSPRRLEDYDELRAKLNAQEADTARIDWLKAEPYERLQKVREWLPISYVPPAPDNLRAAIDNAMKHP
jgi:hypothetical protein